MLFKKEVCIMRRTIKKVIAVLVTITAIIASYCSNVYADAAWEPELPAPPLSMFIIALLVIAAVIITVLIIRKLRKISSSGNGSEKNSIDTDGSKEDSTEL
jgi:TRAP-type C4-dicarboxylate transport system permease small subunit